MSRPAANVKSLQEHALAGLKNEDFYLVDGELVMLMTFPAQNRTIALARVIEAEAPLEGNEEMSLDVRQVSGLGAFMVVGMAGCMDNLRQITHEVCQAGLVIS